MIEKTVFIKPHLEIQMDMIFTLGIVWMALLRAFPSFLKADAVPVSAITFALTTDPPGPWRPA